VDLQERHQLDLASQVAGVKARARPWRAIIFTVLAVVAAGISYAFGRDLKNLFEPGHLTDSIAAAAAAAAFLIFGTLAVVSLASQARQTLQSVTGSAHAAVVRYAIVLIGAILTIAITLGLLKVPVGQLLVGGALATIIITIAGQQSLSNIFAGLVLLLSRPFQVGDVILLRSGALGGQLEGTVTEIGITYLRLDTGNDVMSLPNSQVLAAAVSQAGRSRTATAGGYPSRSHAARPAAQTATIGKPHMRRSSCPRWGAARRNVTRAAGMRSCSRASRASARASASVGRFRSTARGHSRA